MEPPWSHLGVGGSWNQLGGPRGQLGGIGRDRKGKREKANGIMGGKGEVAIGKRLGKGSKEVRGESSKQIE